MYIGPHRMRLYANKHGGNCRVPGEGQSENFHSSSNELALVCIWRDACRARLAGWPTCICGQTVEVITVLQACEGLKLGDVVYRVSP